MARRRSGYGEVPDGRAKGTVMRAVVILTALDLEYQAVRRHLEEIVVLSHSAGTLFEVGHLPDVTGSVVLGVTGEGNMGAAVLAERAIAMFRPRALLCSGIAGGLKQDIALGDVVVATKVYALHGGRVHQGGFASRPRAWPASHELEQFARHVTRAGTWPWPATGELADQSPEVHFKPIASGEVVLGAGGTPLAAQLHGTYNDAVAVEMESAGIAQAAHLNRSLPTLTVRGISDRADLTKPETDATGWPGVAARHAATFATAVAALVLRGGAPVSPAALSYQGHRRVPAGLGA